jgi:hypothetical protein
MTHIEVMYASVVVCACIVVSARCAATSRETQRVVVVDAGSGFRVARAQLVLGDASARLPGCRTVETDWDSCVDAGTYVGDPALLMGNHPYIHGVVVINYYGADAPTVACPAGTSPGELCLERLPFGSARIEVREGP